MYKIAPYTRTVQTNGAVMLFRDKTEFNNVNIILFIYNDCLRGSICKDFLLQQLYSDME